MNQHVEDGLILMNQHIGYRYNNHEPTRWRRTYTYEPAHWRLTNILLMNQHVQDGLKLLNHHVED